MKSKLLLLSFLMLLTVATNYAQGSSRGISVQGIARDGNNNARAAATLQLKFSLYYTTASTVNTLVTITQELTTDAFGVFSYVIPAAAIDNTTLLEKELYLKIDQLSAPAGSISDEKLNYVPYAMSASNGVPTGSIMPYMGTTAPAGWALCDGSNLPSTATVLIAMVGNRAPNLNGMFLRGAGNNTNKDVNEKVYIGKDGPALNKIQLDSNKSHNHQTTEDPHSHGYTDIFLSEANNLSRPFDLDALGKTSYEDTPWNAGSGNTDFSNKGWAITKSTTGVKTLNLKIVEDGGTESRPVSYGVNYIIKL